MRLTGLFLSATLTLAACEKHTDAKSPCFGKDGKPVVTRGAAPSLLLLPPAAAPMRTKDCDFSDIGSDQ